MEIKVLTYNTSLIFPEYESYVRAINIRNILIRGNWDIIGLCEVYHSSLRKLIVNNEKMMETYPWINYASKTVNGIDNGLVLFSKYELRAVQRYQFRTFYDKWYNKILPPKDIVFAIAEVDGTDVGIFLTHLQWGDTKEMVKIRNSHIVELREFMDEKWGFDKPMILLGDLNISPDGEMGDLICLKEQFRETQDWWEKTHDITNEPGYTWDPINTKVVTPLSYARLDFIMSNRWIEPKMTRIIRFTVENSTSDYFSNLGLRNRELMWYIFSMIILRIFLLPSYLVMIIGFNIYRLIEGRPLAMYYSSSDLSDHFALEGRAEIIIRKIYTVDEAMALPIISSGTPDEIEEEILEEMRKQNEEKDLD